MPIIIEKKEKNWTAYIRENAKDYEVGIGKTYEEAVGDLILKNLIVFSINIVAIKTSQSNPSENI